MRPDFRVLVNGEDRSDIFRRRLVELSVTDESGYQSDTVSVRLDDRDGKIRLPRKGAVMEVYLGYEETGRVNMGRYTVDELEVSGPPDTLSVRGKAVDMIASLKAQKTRSWDDTTIGDIVRTIASDHDLDARIGSSLNSIAIPHLDQTEESDLNLLTRLGERYDAVAKPAGPYLLFVPQGESSSASGTPTTAVTIDRNQTTQHRVTMPDRGRYRSVLAYYHDVQEGARTLVRAGSGSPAYTLRHPYPTAAEARSAAQTKLRNLTRRLATLTLTVAPGFPQIAAETPLRLTGFRSGVDRLWTVTAVTHRLSGSGFRTLVQAALPNSSDA